MSTHISTLPAIRALLWERWRVMRWVTLGAMVVYGGVGILIWLGAMLSQTQLTHHAYETSHTIILPILLFFGIICNYAHSHDGKNYCLGVPNSAFRLPISNEFLSVARLFLAGFGMALLLASLLVVDAFMARPFIFSSRHSILELILVALLLIAILHAWFMLTAHEFLTLPTLFVFPLIWIFLFASDASSQITSFLVAPCLVASAFVGARAYGIRRSGIAAGIAAALNPRDIFSLHRLVPVPMIRRPMLMLMWYEWRTWGWIVIGLVLVSTGVPLLTRLAWPEQQNAELSNLLWFLVVTTALAIGWVQLMIARGEFELGTSTSNFTTMRPLRTRAIALGRMAGSTSILLVASVFILLGVRLEFGPVSPFEMAGTTILIFLVVWAMMHAFILALAIGCLANILAGLGALLLLVIGVASEDLFEKLNFYVLLALSFATVTAMTALLTVHGVLRAWMVFGGFALACVAAICLTLLANTLGDFPTEPTLTDDGMLALLFVLAMVGPVIWQLYLLHRRRHGGVGWLPGRGR